MCITEKLPSNITLIPGSDFTTNFSGLQQLISSDESTSYYYIKSVPDAIFIGKTADVVHIYEGSNLLEVNRS